MIGLYHNNTCVDMILEDLKSHDYTVSQDTLLREIVVHFEKDMSLPGVIVTKGNQVICLLSRERCYEILGRPYSLELF